MGVVDKLISRLCSWRNLRGGRRSGLSARFVAVVLLDHPSVDHEAIQGFL